MKKILEFLNSKFVFILLLVITFGFIINWNDLKTVDYILIITAIIYGILLAIKILFTFINKRLKR